MSIMGTSTTRAVPGRGSHPLRALSLLFAASAVASVAACNSAPPPPKSGADDQTPAYRVAVARVTAATDVLHEMNAAADGLVPVAIAHAARCVAIVPGLIHAGLLLGARAGRGIVTCRSAEGWTDPKFFVLDGASAGLQAGVQSIDLVMLAMNDATAAAFIDMKLQLGASTSFAAGPLGRNVEASSDVTLAPVLYYSRARGVFAGVDLSGTSVSADEESLRAFYGDARDFGILLRGTRAVPPAAAALRAEVERVFAR